ncbi:MAG: NAD(P)H-quinone oxidoreductase [Bacteroidetes bacterium]|nr:MAG: NAD(P)H-quinone oxidoreductase [Bacteroidota bacterium]
MRAVIVRNDQLVIDAYPDPEPGPREVCVRVHATALNRADLLQRRGAYPPPPGASPILGLEMAGVVEAVGDEVVRWEVGDRVCGLLAGGGYAERAVIHEDLALPIPDGLGFEEAAAIPEVFMTAYQALHWLGCIEAGEHVLIHAGASGVGTAAIQLARLAEAHPFVTASRGKLRACLDLGAEAAIDYREEDFAARVRALTDGHGAGLILDVIGAPYLEPNLRALALDGRIVLLAMMGGAVVEGFDLRALFARRGRLVTSTLRNRDLAYKIALARALEDHAWEAFARGTLRPVIDRIYDWEDVETAHRRMAQNRNVGKIVLRIR